jgi:hypothetical protein
MRVTKQTDRYVILDDVLPPEQFELMVEYAARNDYARNPRWHASWGGERMIVEDVLGRHRGGRHAVLAVRPSPTTRRVSDGRARR